MELNEHEICGLGIAELGSLYRKGELSPVDVTETVLARIDRLNPALNAYVSVFHESAMASAGAAHELLRAGIDLGPLHGIPYSIKDIIAVRGSRTTAASRLRLDAPLDEEDAEVVRRLRAGGGILLGKVNLHEFALGVPDADSPFGFVRNPRKAGHQTGGSSSGSGAATAAGLGVFSLGTDTGASIRHPAANCGVVGLKSTFGRVSTRGILPLAHSLDHAGPLARCVADAAVILETLAGFDAGDRHSALVAAEPYHAGLGRDIRALRFGAPTNPIYSEVHSEVARAFDGALRVLQELGLQRRDLWFPRAEETLGLTSPLVRTIMQCEGGQFHEQYRGREELYNRDTRDFFVEGRQRSALEYLEAMDAKQAIRQAWLDLFEQVDVLVLPATMAPAPAQGAAEIEIGASRYPARSNARFMAALNVTGLPAIALPAAVTSDGLPVAVQLAAPPFRESRLLTVAHQLERALGVTSHLGIAAV